MAIQFCASSVTVDTIGRAAVANVESRRDLLAAEAGEAPRLHCDVREPHRLPKTHRNADARKRRAASADRQIGIVGVGPIGRKNLQPANRKGKEARPAHVGHGVHELARALPWRAIDAGSARSEEHTSELQSLMRISYAVFCL